MIEIESINDDLPVTNNTKEKKWKEEEDPTLFEHSKQNSYSCWSENSYNSTNLLSYKINSVSKKELEEDSRRRLSCNSTKDNTIPTIPSEIKNESLNNNNKISNNSKSNDKVESSTSVRKEFNKQKSNVTNITNVTNNSTLSNSTQETEIDQTLYSEKSLDVSKIYFLNYSDKILFSLKDNIKLQRNKMIVLGIISIVISILSLSNLLFYNKRNMFYLDFSFIISLSVSLFGLIKLKKPYIIVSLIASFLLLIYSYTLFIIDGLSLGKFSKSNSSLVDYLLNFLPFAFFGYVTVKNKIFLDNIQNRQNLIKKSKYKQTKFTKNSLNNNKLSLNHSGMNSSTLIV